MTTMLVYGIDHLFAAAVARWLSVHTTGRLIGLGERMPGAPTGRAEILTATLNGQQLVELLRATQVQVVLQPVFMGEETPVTSRELACQQNVLRTMELLGACAVAGVRRVILRSSTLVYGASYRQPAFINEQQPLADRYRHGLLRDYIEVDSFSREFARKHPQLGLLLLRCASFVGGGIASPLTRYLARPYPPTLLGFDPRIQVLHPDDAAQAFGLAAMSTATGSFNLAATAPVKLAHAIRLAGRQPMPFFEPLFNVIWPGAGHDHYSHWPFEPDFFRYGCVADIRRAESELSWTAEYSTEAVLRALTSTQSDHAEARSINPLEAFLSRRSAP